MIVSKERPMLFNAAMVRAILDGSKTQTRRIIKNQPPYDESIHVGLYHPTIIDRNGEYQPGNEVFGAYTQDGEYASSCPYGEPGNQLWVRETWRTDDSLNDKAPSTFSSWPVKYEADNKVLGHGAFLGNTKGKTRVSIHMPRWASRIQLEITGVRVERLQDIGRGDAMEEGCPFPNMAQGNDPRKWYAELWEAINGAGSWDANPGVWVIEFKRVKP